MLKGIFIAFFCFIIFAVLHIAIFHNFKVKRCFRMILTIWLALFNEDNGGYRKLSYESENTRCKIEGPFGINLYCI